MSLHGNDVCYLEVEDYNLYEEEASDHAFTGENPKPPTFKMEAEKRIRREIANSNERRRMQSINAGFQALRTLLPRHEGEKLSKAAILQQTAEYIYSLEQEKTRLLSQNCQLKRLLNQHEGGEVPLKKRKREIITHVSTIIPDSTEDVSSRSPEPVTVLQKKDDTNEIRIQLERERRLRQLLEQQVVALQTQLVPECIENAVLATPAVTPAQLIKYEIATVAAELPAPEPSEHTTAECVEPINTCIESAPLLEAAIKAEPRVEVEILAENQAHNLYIASTSRQNLETIVEAIRHLEGDHLFGEDGTELPLALTKKDRPPPTRPGVIVVKHS